LHEIVSALRQKKRYPGITVNTGQLNMDPNSNVQGKPPLGAMPEQDPRGLTTAKELLKYSPDKRRSTENVSFNLATQARFIKSGTDFI